MFKQLCAAVILGSGLAVQAAPVQYNFTYELAGGGVLSGSLMGEVQGDNNTVVVTSMKNFVKFNSVEGPSLPFVESVQEFFSKVASASPTVSLNGSVMDLIACTDGSCVDGFLFDGLLAVFSVPFFNSGSSFGSKQEAFDAARWNLVQAPIPGPNTGVPEPGSLALLGLGLVGLAATYRRKS